MRRRLRKKLRLGEFQCLGFEVTGIMAEVDPAVLRRFARDLRALTISQNLLNVGGIRVIGHKMRLGLERNRESCTDADRAAVSDWLRSRSEVTNSYVHPLMDAWHPDKRVSIDGQSERAL